MGEKKYIRLDDYWPRVLDMLRAGNATGVRDYIADFRDRDIGLFNGLYWRVDKWLSTRLMIKGRSDEEVRLGFSDYEAGRARLATYLGNMKGSNEWWQTADLPRILSEIDAEAVRCRNGHPTKLHPGGVEQEATA